MKELSHRSRISSSKGFKKLSVALFLAIMLLFESYLPTSPAVAQTPNCANPVYATAHPDQCSGVDSGNPYCQGDNCGVDEGIDKTAEGIKGNVSTTTDIRLLIFGWIQFFLGFIFLVAVVGLIYAGVLFVTSLGNDGGRQKATKIITATLIGIIVILIAYGLVNTIIRATS